MKGLVAIDKENRNRLTVHFDKIKALMPVFELLEVKSLSFDELNAKIIAETL